MTTAAEQVRELRNEMLRVRAEHGRSSGYSLDAFTRYMREASRLGFNPTSLDQYQTDEKERYFSHVVAGPDGHSYWTGSKYFTRNDGLRRRPERWWWEHIHGAMRHGDNLARTCDDPSCISPPHLVVPDRSLRHRLYAEDQLIGALQVYAMRHGHVPTRDGWDAANCRPSASVFQYRFGRWSLALRAAGLEPSPRGGQNVDREQCMASVRHAREFLGRWPLGDDYRRNPALRAALKTAGLPSSHTSIQRHLGDWSKLPQVAA